MRARVGRASAGGAARRALGAAFLVAPFLLAPSRAAAQGSPLLSKEVGIGEHDASLAIGFADGSSLGLEVRGGRVRLNGEEIGSADDALDASWRDLLERAAQFDGDALVALLRGWSPPPDRRSGDTTPADAAVGARMDRAIEAALSGSALPSGSLDLPEPVAGAGATHAGREADDLARLLRRPERLVELGEALGERGMEGAEVHVGEDVVVAPGEVLHRDVIVVDGELDVRGQIDGDVLVVGGNLRLSDDARVTGDVRIRDGRVRGDGVVDGDLDVERGSDARPSEAPAGTTRTGERRSGFGEALGDLLRGALLTVVLAVVGGGLAVRYGGDRLGVVAETAHAAPMRAALVGVAGAFLAVPTWILGGVALVLTLIGILAIPFWIVLFPIALGLAVGVGYLGVAQAMGEWVARRRLGSLAWVRESNPFTTVVAGIGTLSLPFLASDALRMLGVLRFLAGLLLALGVLSTVAAVFVGFGAVLLTRGGQRTRWTAEPHRGHDRWTEEDS